MLARTLARLLLLPGALFACGSEAINRGGAGTGATGGSGATGGTGAIGGSGGGTGGASGTSGTGGVSGTAPLDIPDYTASPCYGEPATTLVYNIATHDTHTVSATCRAEGSRTRVYVADELWETLPVGASSPLTQDEVDAFMVGYELRGAATSYRPDLGVLPTDELVFGELDASVLTDGKLPIFVIDSGGAGEGYLCSWCDRVELHLDYPLLGSLHTEKTLSIAAHESFHAIHHGIDPNESFWVDESLAEAAMSVNGFFTDSLWLKNFLRDTNIAWGPTLADAHDFNYGAGLLLGTYLWEQGGPELMRAITEEPGNEWEGIETALEDVGSLDGAWSLWTKVGLAAFLDDPASGYEFKSFDTAGLTLTYAAETGAILSDTLAPYGLVYVTFDEEARNLTLTADEGVAAKLVFSGSPASVLDVTPGEKMSFHEVPRVLLLTSEKATPFELSVETP